MHQVGVAAATKSEYKPGVVDDLFLNLFRNKLVQVIKPIFYFYFFLMNLVEDVTILLKLYFGSYFLGF
jgi:hypothetical protein